MGEFVVKNLGNGKATTSKVAIYTVPAGHTAIVRSITLANIDVVNAVTVQLTADFGQGSIYCAPKNLLMSPGFFFEHDINITMESGDKLEISASIDAAIDYIVSGVEEI